jgi:hypothetical protein
MKNFDWKENFNWDVIKHNNDELLIKEYITPVSHYKDIVYGNSELLTVVEDNKRIQFDRFYGKPFGGYVYVKPEKPIEYKILIKDDEQVMVNNLSNLINSYYKAINSYGNVLVGGWGLGITAQFLSKNNNVKNITVIEYEKDFVEMMKDYVPKNVKLLHGDFKKYVDNVKNIDTFIVDIWSFTNKDDRKELKEYRQKLFEKFPKSKILTVLNPVRGYNGW